MKCHDWIALEVFPCNTGGLEKLFLNITSHQSINKIRAPPIKSGKWRKQIGVRFMIIAVQFCRKVSDDSIR